jgi:hypothetical protein
MVPAGAVTTMMATAIDQTAVPSKDGGGGEPGRYSLVNAAITSWPLAVMRSRTSRRWKDLLPKAACFQNRFVTRRISYQQACAWGDRPDQPCR